ncbi:hypothetical protein BKA64DRAFT_703199 [Cadophora sp. MPI-SDFR-AT-0126]|nr:hypothetical protein BKA64DRAFT_703199 [Leotiomycetes sp. MPI-SDFR-AT-0126]
MSPGYEAFFNPVIDYHTKPVKHQLRPQSQYSLREACAEAELLIFGKLRLGLHPKYLEQELDRVLQTPNDEDDSYQTLFLCVCQRMIKNLERKDIFKWLPSLSVYGELVENPVRTARFEVQMFNRFEDRESFEKSVMDEGMGLDTDEEAPFDSSFLDILELLNDTIVKEVEENFILNWELLQESRPEPFASANAENPFVYGAYPKAWEGPGNRPGQYTVPNGPCVPLHKHRVPKSSSDQTNELVMKCIEEAAGFTSRHSMTDFSDSSNNGFECSFKSIQTSMTTPSIHPRTPKNKLEQPQSLDENVGLAFRSRPVSLGSPIRTKRPQKFGKLISGLAETKASGIRLDTYFDLQVDTQGHSAEEPCVAKLSLDDNDNVGNEQGCRTLEECMNWVETLIRKFPLPEASKILGEENGWSNAMNWD